MSMHNPDPKKYKLKKLRGKGYVLVDKQLVRWRKANKLDPSRIPSCKPLVNRKPRVKPTESDKLLSIDFFGDTEE